jgi:hypothetical protein
MTKVIIITATTYDCRSNGQPQFRLDWLADELNASVLLQDYQKPPKMLMLVQLVQCGDDSFVSREAITVSLRAELTILSGCR